MSYTYFIPRILATIPVLLGAAILVFMMLHAIPGDPVYLILGDFPTPEAVAAMRHNLGLDRALHVQFFDFLTNALQGDLGRSVITNRHISEEIALRFPLTLKIAFAAVVIEVVVGLSLGIAAALKHRTFWDNAAMVVALLGVSTPSFWLALLLMLAFAVYLPIFPISGYWGWTSLVLPSITLGLLGGGRIARMSRSTVLEVLGQDYVRTARAQGLPERIVIDKHALRNALIPVETLIGMDFGSLLGGAIITETVFALPGVAQLAINGINRRDFPMVQGVVLLVSVVFIVMNLVVDLGYALLDPRTRYE